MHLYSDVINDADTHLKLDPSDNKIRIILGKSYEFSGDDNHALQIYENLYKSGEVNSVVEKILSIYLKQKKYEVIKTLGNEMLGKISDQNLRPTIEQFIDTAKTRLADMKK